MKNLFKVVTVFATLALLVGTMVALSVSAAEGDQGTVEITATAAETTATAAAEIACGDANGDGAINMKDVLAVRKYVAGLETEIDVAAADTNNDEVINTKDILNLRKYLADMIDVLPVVTEPTAA